MNRILLFTLLLASTTIFADFESPSKQHIEAVTLDQIKYNLKGKGVGLEYRELFDKAILEEKVGFIGYHGNSIDFLVYQDVIRLTIEEILGIPIRKDFHFVSIPIRPNGSIQTLEELIPEFTSRTHHSKRIQENTFPLNFSLYSNHNRFGLNSVLNFSKNTGSTPIKLRRELEQMFEYLGIDSQLVHAIYDLSHQYLESKAGVLLQLFDTSPSPYALTNTVSYSSYPNGFIAENHVLGEYFLDKISSDFPHELRVVLGLSKVLNPTSAFIIKRYTKIQPSKLKTWEQELRITLRSSPFNPMKREELRQNLLNAWKT